MALKGAESRPRMYFWLVARGLYLRNYYWYSKKPKTYAIRLAKAVHIANYERWKCQTETWRARLDTTLRLIKLSFTQAVELQIVHIYVLQQGEDSNRELFRVLCLKVRFWAAYLVVFLIRGSLLTKTLCYCLYLVANSHISNLWVFWRPDWVNESFISLSVVSSRARHVSVWHFQRS